MASVASVRDLPFGGDSPLDEDAYILDGGEALPISAARRSPPEDSLPLSMVFSWPTASPQSVAPFSARLSCCGSEPNLPDQRWRGMSSGETVSQSTTKNMNTIARAVTPRSTYPSTARGMPQTFAWMVSAMHSAQVTMRKRHSMICTKSVDLSRPGLRMHSARNRSPSTAARPTDWRRPNEAPCGNEMKHARIKSHSTTTTGNQKQRGRHGCTGEPMRSAGVCASQGETCGP